MKDPAGREHGAKPLARSASHAAGAIFTIPAFVTLVCTGLTMQNYWQSVALMVIGGLLGILRDTAARVMVEDRELLPESVAAVKP
jgi:uncharacterized oligopeptide transporter (OPT) family protein